MDIKLILLDVDGVLTDGSILIDGDGHETKRFNVKDGLGIKAAQVVGIRVGIVSARSSRPTARRARELGIDPIMQGVEDKAAAMADIARAVGVKPAAVAFLGDDLADLGVMRRVGYPMAVADAAEEVRAVAKHVTAAAGGRGAVREAIEHLLKAMGKWEAVLAKYDSA